MSLQYDFKCTVSVRKTLADEVGLAVGGHVTYQGAPTFAYAVGGYTIGMGGILTCPDEVSPKEAEQLAFHLWERGYCPGRGYQWGRRGKALGAGRNSLTVEVPKEGFTETVLANLDKIVANKRALFQKAFGTDRLPVTDTGSTLKFPWFTPQGMEGEAEAYSRFVTALCWMAKKLTRVTDREADMENEKFAMRLFLVRLGFIGEEYKTARKILLKNLSGNSSWKSGHAPERTPQSDERDDTGTVYGIDRIRKL